jgi:hypothetical protein
MRLQQLIVHWPCSFMNRLPGTSGGPLSRQRATDPRRVDNVASRGVLLPSDVNITTRRRMTIAESEPLILLHDLVGASWSAHNGTPILSVDPWYNRPAPAAPPSPQHLASFLERPHF